MRLPANPLGAALSNAWASPTLMSWLRIATRSGAMLALLALAVSHFSEQEMAVWLLFLTVNALQGVADAGLTPTFARMYAFALSGLGKGDLKDLRGTVVRTESPPNFETLATVAGTARVMHLRLAAIWAAVLATAGTWAMTRPIGSLLDGAGEGWAAWFVVACVSVVWVFGSQYFSLLQGTGNVALNERIGTIISLAQLLTCTPVLALDGGLLAFALAYNLWFVVHVAVSAKYSRDLLKSRYQIIVRATVDRQVADVVWPAAWRSGVGVFFGYGTVQLSGIAYAQLVPAEHASPYLLALRVMNLVRQFAAVPMQSHLPRLTRLRASGLFHEMCRLAQGRMRLGYWVLVGGTLAVDLLAQPAMDLIGSQIQFVSSGLWALLMLAIFVERFGAMHLQLYSTTNHILWHWINGISGALFIVMTVGLYPSLEVYAFPAALLISNLTFYSWYSAKLSYSAMPMAPWQFERTVVPAPFLLSIVYCVTTAYGAT